MVQKIITPPALRRGSRVALIAPAGLADRGRTEEAAGIMESWGLEIMRGRHLYERYGVFAGTDEQRLADLQWAMDDKAIDAVVCARGGYGMSRIIDGVDFSSFSRKPKWIVGYSDITVLHLFVNCGYGIKTIHGEMPLNYAAEDTAAESLDSLKQALFSRLDAYSWSSAPYRGGKAEGRLLGGNLSLISHLAGTGLRDCLKGTILFIEERGEYMYSFDRMVTGLRLAGVLKGLRGLIVGGLTGLKESPVSYAVGASDIIMDAVKDYDYPVAFGFPAGHIPDNRAFYCGADVKLEVAGADASLRFI
ncbi:MAG: LD-carboxypeptidase [Bacteroidales bacterium]|nr:LD-carboxypeptidase [Bacteroidales bacterium]